MDKESLFDGRSVSRTDVHVNEIVAAEARPPHGYWWRGNYIGLTYESITPQSKYDRRLVVEMCQPFISLNFLFSVRIGHQNPLLIGFGRSCLLRVATGT